MAADRIEAIKTLLDEAEAAHAVHEATELGGVYDQDWPRWYAAYVVEHGVEALVGREVSAEWLAAFLGSRTAEFEAADPKPTETWAAYTARRVAEEL